MTLVKDIMSSPVYSIDVEKTAKDAAEIMAKTRRGFLIITSKGLPVGVISDSDLIKITAKDLKASTVNLNDVMSKPVITISPSEDIQAVVNKMKKSNIHRVPVMDKGKLVGVISLSDVARKVSTRTVPSKTITAPAKAIDAKPKEATPSELLELRLKMKEETPEIKEEFTSGICENCGIYSENLKNIND